VCLLIVEWSHSNWYSCFHMRFILSNFPINLTQTLTLPFIYMTSLTFGREALRTTLISSRILGTDAYVVVAGPANVYAHYVATRDEYGVQRYEGASTLFGPCRSHRYFRPAPGYRPCGVETSISFSPACSQLHDAIDKLLHR
jgi:Neutral/alkaline non-lysosomal ceramidase, N-terminal